MKVGILTISDTRDLKTDLSGKAIEKIILEEKFQVVIYKIVKDEIKEISDCLNEMLELNLNVILTTGGTGLTSRDVTPEATKLVIDKEVPGISEAIRFISYTKVPNAMLSRGISGIKNKTLIINLPGSPKAILEILPSLIGPMKHSKELLAR